METFSPQWKGRKWNENCIHGVWNVFHRIIIAFTTVFAHKCHYFPFVSKFSIVDAIKNTNSRHSFLSPSSIFQFTEENTHFMFYFRNKRREKTTNYFLQIISTMVETLSWHECPIVRLEFDFHIINGTFSGKVKEIRSWLLENDRKGSLQKEEWADESFFLAKTVSSMFVR